MFKPRELEGSRPISVHGGKASTTDKVWAALAAARSGEIAGLDALINSEPELATCMYDYTTPMHMAVLGGHLEVVKRLIDLGALAKGARNHPFLEPLADMARDRGFGEITAVLETASSFGMDREWPDVGVTEHGLSAEELAFQHAVDEQDVSRVRTMLEGNRGLVENPDYFWGEGLLAMPAKDGNAEMVQLLLDFGATVPGQSKWGARYYFKHMPIVSFLLGSGMDPEHRNWRGFTLLHDMAHMNQIDKARLLLRYGADINAVDGEYETTPLGYAAKWGHLEFAEMLLEEGADVKAGRPWSTPDAWAEMREDEAMIHLLWRHGA